MKTHILALSLSLLFTLPVLAEQVISLPAPVQAQIMPVDPRCAISLSTSEIDYGEMTKGQMQQTSGQGNWTLGKRVISLNANCPFSRAMSFRVGGLSAADGNVRYGNKGSLRLVVSDPRLDGQHVQLAEKSQSVSSPESALVLKAGSRFELLRSGLPVQGKSFSARLEIEPILSDDASRVTSLQDNTSNLSIELLD